jgi:site-specific recombinase XerD
MSIENAIFTVFFGGWFLNMMENMVSLFLNFRKAEGLADSTLKAYAYHLKKFTALIPEGTDDYRSAVLEYLSTASNPNTYNIKLKYLRKFFSWCKNEGLITCNSPTDGIHSRKGTNRIVHIENQDLENLLALFDKKSFCSLRSYVLIVFTLDTALRPNEALNLKRECFDFSALLVTVPSSISKVRQPRTLPMSNFSAMWVQKLLNAHNKNWKNPTVFCSQDGSPLLVSSWNHILTKYSAKLGVKIAPYFLRHASALGMLRNGMNLFALRDMLGHNDISTTQIYLSLTLDDLRREHSQSNFVNTIFPQRNRQRKIS